MKAEALAVPTHQGVGLEDMQCLNTAGPNAVQPNPEQALAPTETEPFTVSLSDHAKLLAKREDFQVEQRAASEEAGQCGEHRVQDRLHRTDANAPDQKKPSESTGTRFLVGTGVARAVAANLPCTGIDLLVSYVLRLLHVTHLPKVRDGVFATG